MHARRQNKSVNRRWLAFGLSNPFPSFTILVCQRSNNSTWRWPEMRDSFRSESECREYGMNVEPEPAMAVCQFCRNAFPSGRMEYRCMDCGRDWATGLNDFTRWNRKPVCEECAMSVMRRCEMCGQEVSVKNAHKWDKGLVCSQCDQTEERIWCPKCTKSFPYIGYLRLAFRDDRPGFYAAALVTHEQPVSLVRRVCCVAPASCERPRAERIEQTPFRRQGEEAVKPGTHSQAGDEMSSVIRTETCLESRPTKLPDPDTQRRAHYIVVEAEHVPNHLRTRSLCTKYASLYG